MNITGLDMFDGATYYRKVYYHLADGSYHVSIHKLGPFVKLSRLSSIVSLMIEIGCKIYGITFGANKILQAI